MKPSRVCAPFGISPASEAAITPLPPHECPPWLHLEDLERLPFFEPSFFDGAKQTSDDDVDEDGIFGDDDMAFED